MVFCDTLRELLPQVSSPILCGPDLFVCLSVGFFVFYLDFEGV